MDKGKRERKAGCTRWVAGRLLRRLGLAIAAGLPVALTPGAPHAALVDWPVLLVDVSASIDADDYRLQRQAYVNVLQDQSVVTLLEGTNITIVEFANVPELVVAWADDSVAAATSYAGHVRSIVGPGPGSTTGIARAPKLALDLLEDKAGRRIIDISGDGPDNVDWFLGVWTQRDRARALRIEINGLAIPTPEEPKVDAYYAENVITGFLEISREHADFERALLMKMHLEIAGAPVE